MLRMECETVLSRVRGARNNTVRREDRCNTVLHQYCVEYCCATVMSSESSTARENSRLQYATTFYVLCSYIAVKQTQLHTCSQVP